MLRFETVSAFIAAHRLGTDCAILPMVHAAELLGVTPAAIAAAMKAGKLDCVEIGASRFVRLSSLVGRLEHLDNDAEFVLEFLIQHLRAQPGPIFYEPLMASIGLTWRTPIHRRVIGEVLERAAELSMERFGVLATVVVHRKSTAETRPGPAFFETAARLGFAWRDEKQFAAQHLDEVRRYFAENPGMAAWRRSAEGNDERWSPNPPVS